MWTPPAASLQQASGLARPIEFGVQDRASQSERLKEIWCTEMRHEKWDNNSDEPMDRWATAKWVAQSRQPTWMEAAAGGAEEAGHAGGPHAVNEARRRFTRMAGCTLSGRSHERDVRSKSPRAVRGLRLCPSIATRNIDSLCSDFDPSLPVDL